MNTARLYLAHLSRAAHNIRQRDRARKKLALLLTAARKLSTPRLQQYLERLERSIQEIVHAEQKMFTKQNKQDQSPLERIDTKKAALEDINRSLRRVHTLYQDELKAHKHHQTLQHIHSRVRALKYSCKKKNVPLLFSRVNEVNSRK